MTVRINARRKIAALGLVVVLAGCTTLGPGPGGAMSWSELPGWRDAPLVTAWPALLNSCQKLVTAEEWRAICLDAAALPAPDEDAVRNFFETRFEPHLQRAGWFRSTGLVTGYYEPLLQGNRTRTERYRYPLYRVPDDLVSVELGALYPELKNRRMRGRLMGRRVVPYFSRGEIDSDRSPLAGNELLWVDDPVALFFLQIQGSGRVQLPSGEMLFVGYADQNGHPYAAIGRLLADRTGLKLEDIDLPTLRTWLADHPLEAPALMNANASYVFFALRDSSLPGPLGSLGVPLLAERAVAVDPTYIPLGVPLWLDTTLPDQEEKPYRQLVFAQDTGGAIKGPVRADLFFGYGPNAETYAGHMRSPGKLYVLLPARSDARTQSRN